MNIDDFIDIEELGKEVNKPDVLFEGAIESGVGIIRGENSPTEVNKFLRCYRQSLLGRKKRGDLFFGDLQSFLGREKFGIEDLKTLLNAVNDSELWFEFSRYISKEKNDCPHLLKLSIKKCIEESHDALEKAFLLAMPIAIANNGVDDQEFRVRNAIRNGLYELQTLFKEKNDSAPELLGRKRQLMHLFNGSIGGLIKLIESASLNDFIRGLVLLWTDVKLNSKGVKNQHSKNLVQIKQYEAYFSVIKKARNWLVHKQVISIDPLDVAFLFMVHSRLLREGLFNQDYKILQYEKSLLEIYSKASSKPSVEYGYRSFSKTWNNLGNYYYINDRQDESENNKKYSGMKKIYNLVLPYIKRKSSLSEKEMINIHHDCHRKLKRDGHFIKALYRAFFRPDIDLDGRENLKLFYKSFADRADFKGDIVLKSMGVNFNE